MLYKIGNVIANTKILYLNLSEIVNTLSCKINQQLTD